MDVGWFWVCSASSEGFAKELAPAKANDPFDLSAIAIAKPCADRTVFLFRSLIVAYFEIEFAKLGFHHVLPGQ